jgi:hypothetical protein
MEIENFLIKIGKNKHYGINYQFLGRFELPPPQKSLQQTKINKNIQRFNPIKTMTHKTVKISISNKKSRNFSQFRFRFQFLFMLCSLKQLSFPAIIEFSFYYLNIAKMSRVAVILRFARAWLFGFDFVVDICG